MERRGDEVFEQVGGVRVGPMQVLEQQHDRTPPRGDDRGPAGGHQRSGSAFLDHGERIRRRPRSRRRIEQLGGRAELAAERVEGRGQRHVGDVEVLVAPTDEDDGTAAACSLEQFRGEAALADAGIALDEDRPRRTGQRLVEASLQHGERRGTTDERSRGRSRPDKSRLVLHHPIPSLGARSYVDPDRAAGLGGLLGGEEAAECALVEHERRLRFGVVVEVDDAADDEVVVAELEDVLGGAVDPRSDALDDRAPRR